MRHYRNRALCRQPYICRRPPSALYGLCRQPCPGRRHNKAVGLSRAMPTAHVGAEEPSAYPKLRLQRPLAYMGRRHSCGPGDPARAVRLTASNLCRRPRREAVGIDAFTTSSIRGAPTTAYADGCRRHRCHITDPQRADHLPYASAMPTALPST